MARGATIAILGAVVAGTSVSHGQPPLRAKYEACLSLQSLNEWVKDASPSAAVERAFQDCASEEMALRAILRYAMPGMDSLAWSAYRLNLKRRLISELP